MDKRERGEAFDDLLPKLLRYHARKVLVTRPTSPGSGIVAISVEPNAG